MKVRYFEHDKLLYVCDTVASNVNFRLLERESCRAIKVAKANRLVKNDEAPNPDESFIDVVGSVIIDHLYLQNYYHNKKIEMQSSVVLFFCFVLVEK